MKDRLIITLYGILAVILLIFICFLCIIETPIAFPFWLYTGKNIYSNTYKFGDYLHEKLIDKCNDL